MSHYLRRGLELIGLPGYYEHFVTNGFDSWETFLLITDQDLSRLHIPPNHCRLIRRMISVYEIPREHDRFVLGSNDDENPGSDVDHPDHSPPRQKRRYRRRPKPDPNAPIKPLTAYVAFMVECQESMGKDMSFSAKTKAIGRAWQNVPKEERVRRETLARDENTRYQASIEEYERTEEYRAYMEYLETFNTDSVAGGSSRSPHLPVLTMITSSGKTDTDQEPSHGKGVEPARTSSYPAASSLSSSIGAERLSSEDMEQQLQTLVRLSYVSVCT